MIKVGSLLVAVAIVGGASAAEVVPAPPLRDGLRAVLVGSTDAALGRGDVESTQLLYMTTVSTGPKYGWTFGDQADVYWGRHDADDGRQSVRDAYEEFVVEARRRRAAVGKTLVVGRYIGAQTVRTDAQLIEVNRWPSHNARLDRFTSDMLRPPRPDRRATDHARIDYRVAAARDRAIEEFLAEAQGLRGAPRPDMLHFDEVEFTPNIWPGMVDLFTRLKPRLHELGVRVSINLGGYGWREAPTWAPDVLEVLPRMTDSVQVEGLPDRAHGGLHAEELAKSIRNVRRALDAGLSLELLPYTRPNRVAPYTIARVEATQEPTSGPLQLPCMAEGAWKLVATLEAPARASFPLGGAPWEMTVVGDAERPAPEGFPATGWSLLVDPQDLQRVYLFRRDGDWPETLEKTRQSAPAFDLERLQGLRLYDQQALYRTTAAFALAACRDFDDSILVHYSPQYVRPDVIARHTGRLSDDWTRWPELLGEPIESDPRITATTAGGEVLELRRRFRNATMVWRVAEGCVRFERPR